MADTNNIPESYPTRDDLERDNHITNQSLIALGLPNSSQRTFNELNSMMKIYSPESQEKDDGDKKYFENRNQYLLSSLIQTINYEPTEENFVELEIPQLRRTLAIDILANNFERILQKDPEGAHKVVEAVVQRLEQKDPNLLKTLFVTGEEDKRYARETTSLLNILEIFGKNSNSLNIETNKKVMKVVFNNLFIDDFLVGNKLKSVMEEFFKTSIDTRNYGQLNELVDDLIIQVKEADPSTIINVPSIFAYLLLADEGYMDPSERLILDKKIYDFLTSYRRTTTDAYLRRTFSRTLRVLIGEEKRADQSPKLLEQQRKFDLEELKYTIESLDSADVILQPDFLTETYTFLNTMFEKYVKENSFRLFQTHRREEKDMQIFKKTFNTFLINFENRNKPLNTIPILSNMSFLEYPGNPFRTELENFYFQHFSKLRKAEK